MDCALLPDGTLHRLTLAAVRLSAQTFRSQTCTRAGRAAVVCARVPVLQRGAGSGLIRRHGGAHRERGRQQPEAGPLAHEADRRHLAVLMHRPTARVRGRLGHEDNRQGLGWLTPPPCRRPQILWTGHRNGSLTRCRP